jgi:hypothetical protein
MHFLFMSLVCTASVPAALHQPQKNTPRDSLIMYDVCAVDLCYLWLGVSNEHACGAMPTSEKTSPWTFGPFVLYVLGQFCRFYLGMPNQPACSSHLFFRSHLSCIALQQTLEYPPTQVWDDVPPKLKVGKCPCAVTWGFPPEKKYGVPQWNKYGVTRGKSMGSPAKKSMGSLHKECMG